MSHHLFSEQTTERGKRERTRAALLDSAISVFADKGYEAARITDITDHAGLANGTFYNYFNDKAALLNETAVGIAVELVKQNNEQMDKINNAMVRVINGTLRIMKSARAEPEWFAVLLEGATVIPGLQEAAVQYLRRDIEMGVEQGHFDVEVDILLINQILALVRTAFLLDRALPDALIRRTCESQLRLLGVPPRRAAIRVDKVPLL